MEALDFSYIYSAIEKVRANSANKAHIHFWWIFPQINCDPMGNTEEIKLFQSPWPCAVVLWISLGLFEGPVS